MSNRGRLLGGLACGLAGCTLIIGDIPVPDAPSSVAQALAGEWAVYGYAGGGPVLEQVRIAGDGAVTLDGGAVTRAERRDDGRWQLDLGPVIGSVSGRFAADRGVGLLVQSDPADAEAFVMLVRRPGDRVTLLGGRTVQLTVPPTDGASAEFGQLELIQGEYRQTGRYTLTEAVEDARTVEFENASDRRWQADLVGGDWLLTPLLQGEAAIGVTLWPGGLPRGPLLMWREPGNAALVDRALFCAGLTVEDGAVVSRARRGTIADDRVEWSDGREGPVATVGNTAVLYGEASFFDDQGTSILPDGDDRLFALMPYVPAMGGSGPQRSWGMALCIGLDDDAAGPTDAGVPDGAPSDADLADAAPGERDAGA